MTTVNKIKKELNQLADPERAKNSACFFKTQKGQYGYGDKFIGIRVPKLRKVSQKHFKEISLPEIQQLLSSQIHEYRFVALVLLTLKYKKGNPEDQKQFFDFYLKNTKHINNWDLVDVSAPNIVGNYLLEYQPTAKKLYQLAESKDLWEKRIAIISTLAFIKAEKLNHTFSISKKLLSDNHDLIHKATGWMLREAGKKDESQLRKFLDDNGKQMARTCLRYAIEKLPAKDRQYYLESTKNNN